MGKMLHESGKERREKNASGTARSKPSLATANAGSAERKRYDPDRFLREQRGLPPLSDLEAEQRGIKCDRDGLVRCRVCGCTEREPCAMSCGWQPGEADLCTSCAEIAVDVLNWMEDAHRPSKAALFREVALLSTKGGRYGVLPARRVGRKSARAPA